MDVNIQFTQNSSSQCWDKTIYLNEQLLKKAREQEISKKKLSVNINSQINLVSSSQCSKNHKFK